MTATTKGVLLCVTLAMAACSHGMQSFELPANVSVAAPDPGLSPDLAALAGAWEGGWVTPGSGLGYQGLLVVEHIDTDEATVLYAWGHHQWVPDRGWYRQKARVVGDGRLEWSRGQSRLSFEMARDRRTLSGVFADETHQPSFVTMRRVRVQAAPPVPPTPAARAAALTVPALPALNIIPPSPDLPPTFERFLGVWEGAWDSGVTSRLVIWGINRATAMVVYAWSDDPAGGFKADLMKRVALVYEPQRKITWGSQPTFTFRLGKDDQTLIGEWEQEGRVSAVIMSRVKEEPSVQAGSVPR